MKNKMKFPIKIVSLLGICLCLFSFNNKKENDILTLNNPFEETNSSIDVIPSNAYNATTVTMTMGELAEILSTKKEHYPFSDEFIEKYQQKSGGYLDNAKAADIIISKEMHSPNQKWHWLYSWYYPSLEAGTYTTEDDAKTKCYSKLLSPELLLWMYEACGVDNLKVKAAFDAAEQGKINSTAPATIAKNMRACVAYEDMLTGLGLM
ncbi:MAG: hypothetical protein ACI31G_05285 [Bacilli bacterium]